MDSLKLLELIPEFGSRLREVMAKDRWTVFAYALVPSFAIGYWLIPPEALSRRGDAIDNITFIALSSSCDAGGNVQTMPQKNVVIVGSDPEEYLIPWSRPVDRFESSLSEAELRNNTTRVELRSDPAIWVRTPLLGVDQPLALLIDGKPTGTILTPGSVVEADEARFEIKALRAQAGSLVLATIIAAFFGLGMTAGVGAEAEASNERG